jgi:predicted lipid-binding transport protein (Tim44 family)
MDGRIDLTTLLLLVVAVVMILKLRSVLGRKTGDEEARYQRYETQQREARAQAQAAAEKKAADKVVTMPRREGSHAEPVKAQPSIAEREEKIRAAFPGNAAVADGLVDIVRADPNFDPAQFMTGARGAYEMIVTSFAEGNRKTLKDLLSKEVFDGFNAAIGDREAKGLQMDQSFVGIKSASITEADLKDDLASVTVRYVSELISAVRDKAGQVIDGDPKKIREVTDVWTFVRKVTSRDPNWKLDATSPVG